MLVSVLPKAHGERPESQKRLLTDVVTEPHLPCLLLVFKSLQVYKFPKCIVPF